MSNISQWRASYYPANLYCRCIGHRDGGSVTCGFMRVIRLPLMTAGVEGVVYITTPSITAVKRKVSYDFSQDVDDLHGRRDKLLK